MSVQKLIYPELGPVELVQSGGNGNSSYDVHNVMLSDIQLNISGVWHSVLTSYFYLTLFPLFVFFFLSDCDTSCDILCPRFPCGDT